MGFSEQQRRDLIDGYLRALELERKPPEFDLLKALIRRHVATFSFSSVGPRLGDELPLDLESLYQRIVLRRRGGYCFEQNGLFFEVLEDLGFAPRLCLARVIDNEDSHPGLTHRISIVSLDGEDWIVDVGFGSCGPRIPVPISGADVNDGDRIFRVFEPRAGELHNQTLKDGAYFSLYRFELLRYGQADCDVGHFYSHKHPDAAFVNHLVVSRILEEEIRSLRNRDYRLIRGSDAFDRAIENGRQLQQLLDQEFDIEVTEAEAGQLFEQSG